MKMTQDRLAISRVAASRQKKVFDSPRSFLQASAHRHRGSSAWSPDRRRARLDGLGRRLLGLGNALKLALSDADSSTSGQARAPIDQATSPMDSPSCRIGIDVQIRRGTSRKDSLAKYGSGVEGIDRVKRSSAIAFGPAHARRPGVHRHLRYRPATLGCWNRSDGVGRRHLLSSTRCVPFPERLHPFIRRWDPGRRRAAVWLCMVAARSESGDHRPSDSAPSADRRPARDQSRPVGNCLPIG
jgi:hypothetical protein